MNTDRCRMLVQISAVLMLAGVTSHAATFIVTTKPGHVVQGDPSFDSKVVPWIA